MKFKKVIENDIESIFFNLDEFAEDITWNQQPLSAIVDNDDMIRKYSEEFSELPSGSHMIMIQEKKLERIPTINDVVLFNGNLFTVCEVKKDLGVLTVFLGRGRL